MKDMSEPVFCYIDVDLRTLRTKHNLLIVILQIGWKSHEVNHCKTFALHPESDIRLRQPDTSIKRYLDQIYR